jgi:hypothetical protein
VVLKSDGGTNRIIIIRPYIDILLVVEFLEESYENTDCQQGDKKRRFTLEWSCKSKTPFMLLSVLRRFFAINSYSKRLFHYLHFITLLLPSCHTQSSMLRAMALKTDLQSLLSDMSLGLGRAVH